MSSKVSHFWKLTELARTVTSKSTRFQDVKAPDKNRNCGFANRRPEQERWVQAASLTTNCSLGSYAVSLSHTPRPSLGDSRKVLYH